MNLYDTHRLGSLSIGHSEWLYDQNIVKTRSECMFFTGRTHAAINTCYSIPTVSN